MDLFLQLGEVFSLTLLAITTICGFLIFKKRYFKKKKPYIRDPINQEKLEAAEKALQEKMVESENIDYCLIAKGSTLDGFDYNWANKVIGLLASQGISATYKSFDTANYVAQFHILVPIEQRNEAAAICKANNINVYV